jgi:hypothetical protein
MTRRLGARAKAHKTARKAVAKKRGGALDMGDRGMRHPLMPTRSWFMPPLGLPAQQVVKLRYAEVVPLLSTLGSLNYVQYAANGVYDPNLSGGGHQPYGFDQWTPLYKNHTVLKSRIDVEAFAISAPFTCGITFSSNGNPISSLPDPPSLIEAGRGEAGVLAPGAPARVFNSTFNLKKLFPDHDPASYQGTVSANPAVVHQYVVWAMSMDASTNTAFTTIVVEYEVLLQDPNNVVPS